MTLRTITDGSPFDGFFKAHLPVFFFEKFKGADLERIETALANFEIIFDDVYQKVMIFPDELDVKTAEVKYLFQLGKLLGIQDIEDLSVYLDDDGEVQGITQEAYDNAVVRQRSYIANTIGRYLLKGTVESITRLLYSKGLDVEVRELWTEDPILGMSGDYFEYDNPLVTKYGDATIGAISGDVYNEETFDLISDISADVPSASAIGDISQYELNYYGYYFALDDGNNLYYKTSNSTDVELDIDTWYLFDDGTNLSVSGDIDSFKLINDKIYIHTTANDLEIFEYNLDTATLTSEFLIDDNDMYYMKFIENGTRVLFDRGNNIEVRDTSTYQKISASVSKPAGNLETIFDVVKKKDGDYFILNTNSIGYILEITVDSYDLYGSPDTYNVLIDLINEAKYDIFRIEDDSLVLIKYNSSTGDITTSYMYFDSGNDLTLSSSVLVTSLVTGINSMFQYSTQLIIMDDDNFGIFHLIDRTYVEYAYINGSGYTYQDIFFLDKFYLKRFDGSSNLDTSKILGWNTFKDALYKSHYFDILLEIGAIESIDIAIEIDSLRDFVVQVIDTVKPAHTELLNILTIVSLIAEEFSASDSLSYDYIEDGGSAYTLKMVAQWDGIHPYKRNEGKPHKFNGSLKFGETTYTFSQAITPEEFDDWIFDRIIPPKI